MPSLKPAQRPSKYPSAQKQKCPALERGIFHSRYNRLQAIAYFEKIELLEFVSSFEEIRFSARLALCIAMWSILSCSLLFPSSAVVSSSIASCEGRAAVFVEFNPCAMFHLS